MAVMRPQGQEPAVGFEIRLAFQYLRAKRRYRFVSAITLLAGLGVGVGVMAMLVTLAVMDGFEEDLKRKLLGNMAPITLTGKNLTLSGMEQVREQTRELKGILGLSPYVRTQVLLTSSGRPVGATLIGVDPAAVPMISRLPEQIQEGGLDRLAGGPGGSDAAPAACAGRPGVLLGRELTNLLGCFYGDPVQVVSPFGLDTPFGVIPAQQTCCVGGIFQTGLYEYDSSFVYMSLAEAQRFLQMDERISGIEVGIEDLYRARGLAAEIRLRVGGDLRVEDWMQKNRRLLSAMRLEKIIAFIVLTLIVLVAVLSILSSLSMTVIEKKKEIAILKALGATRRSIQSLFIVQGMLIGLAGTLAGAAAGIAVCKLLQTYPVLNLPQDVFYQLTLPVRLQVLDVVAVSMATLALCLFATLYPARRASFVPPAATLRYI